MPATCSNTKIVSLFLFILLALALTQIIIGEVFIRQGKFGGETYQTRGWVLLCVATLVAVVFWMFRVFTKENPAPGEEIEMHPINAVFQNGGIHHHHN